VTYVAQSAAACLQPCAKRLMDQVIEATLLHGLMGRAEAEARAVDLFPQAGPAEPETIGNRYPHQVSGGQLQRVMTAMALCPKPDLVVFDEPTTALDVTTQIDVLAAIKEAIRDTGVAALYITHDLAVVAQVSRRHHGAAPWAMVEYGTPNRSSTARTRTIPGRWCRCVASTMPKTPAPPVLQVQNVTARYRGTHFDVLKNVYGRSAPGQTLAVVGESGSGKSTLARAITGLLPPSSGRDHALPGATCRRLKDRTKDDLRECR
jgi:peptide/nickel transport system ATP-binding protein